MRAPGILPGVGEVQPGDWAIHPRGWIEATCGALYLQTTILREKKDTIALAVHWQDSNFLSWLNLYLEKAGMDGTLKRLKRVYLESEEWLKK